MLCTLYADGVEVHFVAWRRSVRCWATGSSAGNYNVYDEIVNLHTCWADDNSIHWGSVIGGYSFVACLLSNLTIGHASLLVESTAPSPNGHTSTTWALNVFSLVYFTKILLLSSPCLVSPSTATTHLLG